MRPTDVAARCPRCRPVSRRSGSRACGGESLHGRACAEIEPDAASMILALRRRAQRGVASTKSPTGSLLSTELRMDGDPHEVHRATRAELLPELGAVVGDGLVGDAQDISNLSHRLALGEKAQNFQFARAQVGDSARVGPDSEERDLTSHFWVKIAAAFGDPTNRLGEEQGIVALCNIAFRAGLDRPCCEYRIVVHAEYDDSRLGLPLQNAAADFEARHARQIQVDQSDVGLMCEIGGVAGIPIRRIEHLDGRIRLEQCLATGHHNRVIIDDENLHAPSSAFRRPGTARAAARVARTRSLSPTLTGTRAKSTLLCSGAVSCGDLSRCDIVLISCSLCCSCFGSPPTSAAFSPTLARACRPKRAAFRV